MLVASGSNEVGSLGSRSLEVKETRGRRLDLCTVLSVGVVVGSISLVSVEVEDERELEGSLV